MTRMSSSCNLKNDVYPKERALHRLPVHPGGAAAAGYLQVEKDWGDSYGSFDIKKASPEGGWDV